jgi:Tfp pilus assembly protein PilX
LTIETETHFKPSTHPEATMKRIHPPSNTRTGTHTGTPGNMPGHSRANGFALVTSLLMLIVLSVMLTGYFFVTRTELATSRASSDTTTGFYAAEAGLNIRAEAIRTKFLDYGRPNGTPPASSVTDKYCDTSATGSRGTLDYACAGYPLTNRTAQTYVVEAAGNPTSRTIPNGENFEGLSAQEYKYSLFSTALSPTNKPEAILEMRFKSRLVPLFQFAAFYNKDLEINPGANMTLGGRVHTNGNLYLSPGSGVSLDISGRVTVSKKLYRGRKTGAGCDGTARVAKADSSQLSVGDCSGSLSEKTDFTAWNGRIKTGFRNLTVPAASAFDPVAGNDYWDKADLRIVLKLDASGVPDATNPIQIRNADQTIDTTRTTNLNACISSTPIAANSVSKTTSNRRGILNKVVTTSTSMYNGRERKNIRMLEVDVRGLMDCIHTQNLLEGGRTLADNTENGLIWHLSVDGPNKNVDCSGVAVGTTCGNDYGVRLRNGKQLDATIAGAPSVKGLSVVTDQALYIQGDFNSQGYGSSDPSINKWKPTATLGDSVNILSNNWNYSTEGAGNGSGSTPATVDGNGNTSAPGASATAIYAAFLSGTDESIASAGSDGSNYNGGLENYPRLHEAWGSGNTLTYRGSFVSLNKARRVNGTWSQSTYGAPKRDWGYEANFDDANKLPPLSPRFVYLRQERFDRQFDR